MSAPFRGQRPEAPLGQGGGTRTTPMADAPYLVALALLEREGRRALPLTGKSCRPEAAEAEDPGETGHGLALELLLRLWQGSDEQAFRRCAGDSSLLLVEMPLESLTQMLPVLKANWVGGGDTEVFLNALRDLCVRGWTLSQAKHEPMCFRPWP